MQNIHGKQPCKKYPCKRDPNSKGTYLSRPSQLKIYECAERQHYLFKSCQTLTKYSLPNKFTQIKIKSSNEWRHMIRKSIEDQNKSKLIEECHKQSEGKAIRKTKTAHIVDKLNNQAYTAKPKDELTNLSKQETTSSFEQRCV